MSMAVGVGGGLDSTTSLRRYLVIDPQSTDILSTDGLIARKPCAPQSCSQTNWEPAYFRVFKFREKKIKWANLRGINIVFLG